MSDNSDDANLGNIPSNSEERRKLKMLLSECTHSLQRIDDEREALKDLKAEISKNYNIPKKIVNKLAQTMYKHNYADVQAEHEHFETLYETLVQASTSSSSNDQNDDENDDEEDENEEDSQEDND